VGFATAVSNAPGATVRDTIGAAWVVAPAAEVWTAGTVDAPRVEDGAVALLSALLVRVA
jgi:hypothetical protein